MLFQICVHGGNEADPEERELQTKPPQIPDIQILCNFISKYLPGLHPKPAVIEQCMYTVCLFLENTIEISLANCGIRLAITKRKNIFSIFYSCKYKIYYYNIEILGICNLKQV